MNIFKELFDLPAKDLFALSVVGALITTMGTLIGTVLRDFIFARSFESWKADRALILVFHRYRDPILLSSTELLHRLKEIVYQTPVNFLSSDLLQCEAIKLEKNSANDPYYRKYKLVSTVYRLCAFLGWLELYRQDITYLDSGRSKVNRKIEVSIAAIKGDLADGHLNKAHDWLSWKDALLFREELRAIGDSMVVTAAHGGKSVLGYSGFNNMLLCEPNNGVQRQWFDIATNFVLDLDVDTDGRDFRRVRCLRLIVHLIDLIELLDKKRIVRDYVALRNTAQNELHDYEGLVVRSELADNVT